MFCSLYNTTQAADNNKVLSEENKTGLKIFQKQPTF
jgi:hypothetical protein